MRSTKCAIALLVTFSAVLTVLMTLEFMSSKRRIRKAMGRIEAMMFNLDYLVAIDNYNANTSVAKDTRSIIKTPVKDHIHPDHYSFLYGQEFQDALDKAESRQRKTILFWHTPGHNEYCFSEDLDRKCGYCKVRYDLELINDDSTDAVIFVFGFTKHYMMPKSRNLNQYWIWRSAEPPPGMMLNEFLPIADEIGFNMTMTHRDNSDIRMPYNDVRNLDIPDPIETLKMKKYFAMAAISNCGLMIGCELRLQYIKLLMEAGMDITTVGGCFPRSIKIRKPRDGERDPMLDLASQHKFYFSFENSYHCKDYITENFFRPIQAGTIPVVWGGKKEDYARFIPENGFIYVEDFKSATHLYEHLKYLDRNDTAYLEYFRWTTSKLPNYREETFVCQICRFLHGINVDDAHRVPIEKLDKTRSYISEKPPRKSAGRISDWYKYHDHPECIRKDLKLDNDGHVIIPT